MSPRFDLAAVERAAAGRSLRLPRGPHRGRVGEARASSIGSSMELHDFRTYHPGDDLRHLDWNAVARTGELVLRVRQDEVSPRIEVVLDASASMAVSPEKAARARELAAWLCTLARHGGLEPSLIAVGLEPSAGPALARGHLTLTLASNLELTGKQSFERALSQAPALRPCGLRLVVSDFLFEAEPSALAQRLARGASGLVLVQVLDPEDLEPSGGTGARLTDAESGEALERLLTQPVIDLYLQRFRGHVALWQQAAKRVQAQWFQVSAADEVDALATHALAALVDAAGGVP